jgi:hypothetical protein
MTTTKAARPGWRVVYGETLPAWERTFPTKKKADAFAKKHRRMGDEIFSIARVIPGEGPQSLMATILGGRNVRTGGLTDG